MWELWLMAAAMLHLGFQATVTALVYPVLVARGQETPSRWHQVHSQHSRRIAPLVVVVYAALLPPVAATGTGVAGEVETAGVVAVAGALLAFATTALVAAPAHGRLGEGWSDRLGRRLVVADRVRLLGAVVCAGGAVGALVGG